jgi:hypothetical protein
MALPSPLAAYCRPRRPPATSMPASTANDAELPMSRQHLAVLTSPQGASGRCPAAYL